MALRKKRCVYRRLLVSGCPTKSVSFRSCFIAFSSHEFYAHNPLEVCNVVYNFRFTYLIIYYTQLSVNRLQLVF